jgi:chromosome segregation protein
VLDNSDRRVPEVDAEEIALTRRLYRSGESEYLVNNNAVRLLDIHLLMAKAQVAENSYSIVSQGMIDKLLTVSPSERKDFFDEACGIKEFQIKRHQADLKLNRTAEHLEQAQVVLAEISPRLKMLAKQVKKLEERREVETELRSSSESYYTEVYRRLQAEEAALLARRQGIEVRLHTAEQSLESVQRTLAELATQTSREEAFQELQNTYQSIIAQKNTFEKQLAIIEGQIQAGFSQAGKHDVSWLTAKLEETKDARAERLDDVVGIKKQIAEAETRVRVERQQLDEIVRERSVASAALTKLQGQLLKDQSEQNYLQVVGLTAVKAVLDQRDRFGVVHGLVAELGGVAEEYRTALEVAAGQHLSSLVVDDERVARQAINFLREQRFGVATFLPLNKVQGRYLSNEEQEAARHPDAIGLALNLITFDARFERIFSFIFGSTLVVPDLEAAERVGINCIRMVTLSNDIAERNGVMRGGFRAKKNTISFSSKLSLSAEDRLQEYQAAIRREEEHLVQLDALQKDSQSRLITYHGEVEGLQAKLQMVRREEEQLGLEAGRMERELTLATSNPADQTAVMHKLAEEKQALIAHIRTTEETADAARKRLEAFNREEEEKKQRVFALQETMQTCQHEVNRVTEELNLTDIQRAKLETRTEDVGQEVQTELGVTLSMLSERLAEPLDEVVFQKLPERITQLKYTLSLIGGIDTEVVKEYESTKERHDFLDNQLSDLEKAATDLRALIAELDEDMKKKRSSAFRKIRKEFNRYFQILFEGGEADLEEIYGEPPAEEGIEGQAEVVEESETKKSKDKLLTGIEVIANPPGKKIKYLNSLSGGERTLTSIALICAILHDNPSPFVILDEVEAALDEANTQRFVRIMTELSERSQFIVITHNRVTMHSAQALYGVVMNGDGVSQLLSVKLEDIARYEEPAAVDKKPLIT